MKTAYDDLARRCKKGIRWGWVTAFVAFIGLLVAGDAIGRLFGNGRVGIETTLVVEAVCSLYVMVLLSPHVRWSVGGQLTGDDLQRERIARLLTPLLEQAHLEMPHLVIVPGDALNAYAAGIWRKGGTIGVTQGAMQRLDDRELQAVLAHEVAHLYHHDSLVSGWWVAFMGVISAVTMACLFIGTTLAFTEFTERKRSSKDDDHESAAIALFFMVVAYLAGIVAIVLLTTGVRWDARRREQLADDRALTWISDPSALSSALSKLAQTQAVYHTPSTLGFIFSVNPQPQTTWFERIWDTHPPIASRLRRIEQLSSQLSHGHRQERAKDPMTVARARRLTPWLWDGSITITFLGAIVSGSGTLPGALYVTAIALVMVKTLLWIWKKGQPSYWGVALSASWGVMSYGSAQVSFLILAVVLILWRIRAQYDNRDHSDRPAKGGGNDG